MGLGEKTWPFFTIDNGIDNQSWGLPLVNIEGDVPSRGREYLAEYNENRYLAKIKSIPPLSEEQQQELLLRWRKFQDQGARNRVVEANLRLVLPIAKATTKRFRFAGKSFPVAWFELIAAGSLGLVQAANSFDPGRGHKFEHYARRSIRNECIHAAKSLLSVVDRPYYAPAPRDIMIDPMLPDMVPVDEYCGSRARPTSDLNDLDKPLGSAHGRHRPWPKEFEVRFKKEEGIVAKILDLRKAGLTLKETADTLGMSTTTVWRREQAYAMQGLAI